MPSSSSHRHPATVTQPASPTGSEPMLSLVEIALGFGPGWPPEQEITVLARRADLEQRRTHHQTHRALYRGNPKGSANTETAVALSAQQALTTTCECGALRDVSALNAGRQCGSCGPRYRPTESHRIQLKMADALISGERILILLPTKGSHSYCIRGRTASLRAAHIARERAARLFHSRRQQSRSSSYNNSSLCGADP